MTPATLPATGPQGPLDELYLRHHALVLRACVRYVQNREEAEDLAQETFLKAARRWPAFRGDSRAGTWLYRIAANHCMDHLRTKRRRDGLQESFTAQWEGDAREDEIESGAPPLRPILDRLREILDSGDRDILYLRFEAGLSQLAISRIAGVSRVAVTKRLAKIRGLARQLWNEAEEGAPLPAVTQRLP